MEQGFVNAPGLGITWVTNPGKFWLVGKGAERLQKDSWGFTKLKKDALPASRCRECHIVVLRYNIDT